MKKKKPAVVHGVSLLSDFDVYLFKEGSHFNLYEKLGSHVIEHKGVQGTLFAVWAPNADYVSVIGDFNDWNAENHPLSPRWDSSGIWEGFVPGLDHGTLYKYHIRSPLNPAGVEKADPFCFFWEVAPKTASIVWDLSYDWGDAGWMTTRRDKNALDAPCSIYEIHLGSWRRKTDGSFHSLSYREMAEQLPAYIEETGFTHVEFLPVMEHPFFGSWGYQVLGFYAPTSRYGTPQEFMYLVDRLHERGIGVILDWVPSHFPHDIHGLAQFDGTHLFEHEDPRQGFHPEWSSYIFNYGRNEVRSFLISSAAIWADWYHADGLRVDAVASILYLDYAREEGEWVPNEHGGNENLPAVHFLRRLNEVMYKEFPDTQIIAEESTAWPMVTRPTYLGGLGFGMKWNMGWMHDTLKYVSLDPVFRKYHHNQLTFSIMYAFSENFMLPLSHDEVVYGKGSLLNKMPGDMWQKFANLRLLFGYMFTHPGKKLLFMGGEFGQWSEWNHDSSLDWHLLDYDSHRGLKRLVGDLNAVYRTEPALHRKDFSGDGFEWVDCGDWGNSIISYIRSDDVSGDMVLVICNFTPVPRHGYRIGVPVGSVWKELLNTDAIEYWGSGIGNFGGVTAEDISHHGRSHSMAVTLPPLSAVVFKPVKPAEKDAADTSDE